MHTFIELDDADFAPRVRKLIGSGQSLSINVRGEPERQLRAHIVDLRIQDPARLGLLPKLQPLLAALMFAFAKERSVSIQQKEGLIEVRIGVAVA